MTPLRFSSLDPPEVRAAKLLTLAGISGGDPEILDAQRREVARGLREYMALDAQARK